MDSTAPIVMDDAFVLVMGTLAMVLVVLVVILFAFLFQRKLLNKQKAFREIETLLQQQEMKSAYAILEAQEQERKRIAEDLHDRLGSRLAAVKLHFHAFKKNEDGNTGFFSKGSELLDGAVDEVREISHNMLSGVLSKFGLVAALEDLCNTLESSKQLSVSLHAHHLDARLDMQIELNIYRIIQELVSNILKHSGATEIIIQLNRYESELIVTVEDNGAGFDNAIQRKRGIGLQNIDSRVQSLKGRWHIDSGKGQGTIVTIEIPFHHDEHIHRR